MLKKRQNAHPGTVEPKPTRLVASSAQNSNALASPLFYRSVIDAIDAHTVVVDREGRIVAVNDAWRAFVARNGGRFPDVLEGAKYLAVCETATGSPDIDAIKPLLNDVLQAEHQNRTLSYECRTPLGNKHFRASIQGFTHATDRFAIITHHDETELHLIATQASASESQLRLIIESSPDCIMRVDRTCRVLSINKAGLALFEANNQSQITRNSILNSFGKENQLSLTNDIAAAAGGTENAPRQVEFTGLLGTSRTIEYRCVRLSAVGERDPQVLIVVQDVTWRNAAEQMRIGAERREALAQLAGGIAHEFNSMLLAAATYLDAAGPSTDKAESRDPLIDKASALVQQAQSLSASLLELFAGPEATQLTTLDLQSWLPDCINRLTPAMPETMAIIYQPSCTQFELQADPLALEQVLRILISNASDATNQSGRVTIDVTPLRSQQTDCVEINVRDNGPGVPETDRIRIFEPFFTTRSRSRRSGLGLAIASRLTEHQGGSLRYEPNQPSGSTFVIRLKRQLS